MANPIKLFRGLKAGISTLAAGLTAWCTDTKEIVVGDGSANHYYPPNPMTAAGDMIVGGTNGYPTRAAKSDDGKVWTMVAGSPAWAAGAGVSDGDKGDITVSGATWKDNFNNIGLAATVSGKALTVALKGADGNDPSATNPVRIPFRDETLITGTPNMRSVTGALSVVLASGGTLGFAAAETGRLYAWAIDNGGTVELALSRTADIFPESNLVSTTAIGSGSDSSSVMYSTSSRSNLACRCIGYVEITTGAVAGEWDNAPSKIQIMGPGVKRTGDEVQTVETELFSVVPCGAIYLDDTIPQNAEGTEVMTRAISITNVCNRTEVDALISGATSGTCGGAMFLLKDSEANALRTMHFGNSYGSNQVNAALRHTIRGGLVGSVTFKIRAGTNSNTLFVNGYYDGNRIFGGTVAAVLKLREVFA